MNVFSRSDILICPFFRLSFRKIKRKEYVDCACTKDQRIFVTRTFSKENNIEDLKENLRERMLHECSLFCPKQYDLKNDETLSFDWYNQYLKK